MFSTTNEKAEAAFVAAKCGEEFCSRKNRRRYYSGNLRFNKTASRFFAAGEEEEEEEEEAEEEAEEAAEEES